MMVATVVRGPRRQDVAVLSPGSLASRAAAGPGGCREALDLAAVAVSDESKPPGWPSGGLTRGQAGPPEAKGVTPT